MFNMAKGGGNNNKRTTILQNIPQTHETYAESGK